MTFNDFKQKFNISLNPQQEEAVQKIDGHYLILAVPGSGKTTVLVTRLLYMTEALNINPKSMLTITYTNAAADDMKKRYLSQHKDKDGTETYTAITFCTINSFAMKILNFFQRQTGKTMFSMLPNDDGKAIIRDLFIKYENDYPTDGDVENISSLISYAKNMALSDEEIKKLKSDIKEFPDIFNDYNKTLRERKLMDFDDQLTYAYMLLDRFPEVLSRFKNRYRYIAVDEAQDTSRIQHMIIRKLADDGNLFMVGDEDQSIYGFRGADPTMLYSFEKVYPDAEVLSIETNYRSGTNIVSAADRFISGNHNRHEKHIKPSRNEKGNIDIVSVPNRYAQIKKLFDVAKECPRDTAVLYRNNESVFPLLNLLDKNNVPYVLKGKDVTFFSNRVVSGLNSLIALAINPLDRDAFLKSYYLLKAYISKKEAEEAASHDVIDARDYFAYLALNTDEGKSFKVKKYWAISYTFRDMKAMTPVNVVRTIRSKLKYDEYITKKGYDPKKADLYEEIASQCRTLPELQQRLSRLSELISEGSESKDGIILSTIHSCKGLEFDSVYLLDMVNELIPGTSDEEEDTEEARRLFYVAMTRAKNNLTIYSVNSSDYHPSSFIREAFVSESREKEPGSAFEGLTVMHNKYGRGIIESVNDGIAVIKFGIGRKNIALEFAIQKGILDFSDSGYE